MSSHGGKFQPEKSFRNHLGTMQGVGTAYGSLLIPYGVALFTDKTVFGWRSLRAQLTSNLLTYSSLNFNPARQLMISTQAMIYHWSHGALSGFFFLKIVPHKLSFYYQYSSVGEMLVLCS